MKFKTNTSCIDKDDPHCAVLFKTALKKAWKKI